MNPSAASKTTLGAVAQSAMATNYAEHVIRTEDRIVFWDCWFALTAFAAALCVSC